ncbi:hypothetical protein B0H17DRAFT_1052493 [Mycena rosella]|uniref:Uncharacterized protein n=1 Tax=Mycena rosella TaxID=1033263 RepID=A0AAD7DQS2_MYCRO|nr:hypothetical protein B0H17DRAFT_1052493 [Mycena rosella]
MQSSSSSDVTKEIYLCPGSSTQPECDGADDEKIPQLVRDVVGFEDDSTVPTLTFRLSIPPSYIPVSELTSQPRVVFLSASFVCLGGFTSA